MPCGFCGAVAGPRKKKLMAVSQKIPQYENNHQKSFSLPSSLMLCKSCEITVSVNAEKCPRCGEVFKGSASDEILDIIKTIINIIVAILLFIFFGIPLLQLAGVMIGLILLALAS
jgi:uncharacterized paraquat-inducible protein A